MQDFYNFKIEKYVFSSNVECLSHPDGECYLYDVFINGEKLTNSKIEWYKKSQTHMYLGYIGFIEVFRNKGILKNYIHPYCINYLKKLGIKKITLRPLSKALNIWIILGFVFEKKFEEGRVKFTILNYLKSKGIISYEEITKYDKFLIKDLVILFKETLKNKDYPEFVDKNSYYTILKKEF